MISTESDVPLVRARRWIRERINRQIYQVSGTFYRYLKTTPARISDSERTVPEIAPKQYGGGGGRQTYSSDESRRS